MERRISVNELKEAIGAALENWDFDACECHGKEQREALEYAYEDPEMLCEDGEYEISDGYRDIWDALSAYAESSAANIVAMRNQ